MTGETPARWLPDGDTAFERMLAAIDGARTAVNLEMYIFVAAGPGERFRAALLAAAVRGVRVRVLLDGFGSNGLPANWWEPVTREGGEVRIFNPLALGRIAIRDHRKLLTVDGRVAFVGGFNIAPEYEGDGVTRGWFDLGAELSGGLVAQLEATFERMWAHHEFRHPRVLRWRRRRIAWDLPAHDAARVLASGPGFGPNAFRHALLGDLARARDVAIVSAYFAPGFRLRRALQAVARRGGRVRLLLAGRSDVPLARAAARSFYGRLLRAGVEIAEYEPQVLHAKLMIVDGAVYVGSSNLDARSLGINYELMVRLADAPLAESGRALLAAAAPHVRAVRREEWAKARHWLQRLRDRWAAFLLTKVDGWFARRQLRRLV